MAVGRRTWAVVGAGAVLGAAAVAGPATSSPATLPPDLGGPVQVDASAPAPAPTVQRPPATREAAPRQVRPVQPAAPRRVAVASADSPDSAASPDD